VTVLPSVVTARFRPAVHTEDSVLQLNLAGAPEMRGDEAGR